MRRALREGVGVETLEHTRDGQVKVLVIDDDVSFCEVMRAFLALENYVAEVRSIQHAPDAIKICATFRPDVVLIDSLMPAMDGDVLGPRLRSILPEARMVSISAMAGKRPLDWADLHVLKTGLIFEQMKDILCGRSTRSPS